MTSSERDILVGEHHAHHEGLVQNISTDLEIDFVLAAKNISKESESENEERRKKYFQMLRKKRLQISKSHVSTVSLSMRYYLCTSIYGVTFVQDESSLYKMKTR